MDSGRDELGQQRDGLAVGDGARQMTLSLVRWRMSGSKPPSSRQVRLVISSQPVPGWPVTHASPASSAIGTAWRWRRAAGWFAGRTRWTGSRCRSSAVDARRPRVRLVLPLVGQHEVDVAERERGQRLLGLGLDELAAQAGRLARERLHRRQREPDRDRLEGGDAPSPGDAARGRRELGLRELGPLEQRLGVADEDERGVGQADPAAGALEQRHARLALEHRELLGDGGRRELQRVGDRGDRAARVQLVQQAQAAEIEHS